MEMLVFVEEGKLENSEKKPGNKARTNNKLNPHWWGARALSTAPSLSAPFTKMRKIVYYPTALRRVQISLKGLFI